MTNTARNFRNTGSHLWEATDGSGVIISLNGTSTMFSVETPDEIKDFYVTGRAQDAFELAVAYARTL